MKERSEQEIAVRAVVNVLNDVFNSAVETQDLSLIHLRKMQALESELCRLFDLEGQGHICTDGRVQWACWLEFVFKDDPRAFKNMKEVESIKPEKGQ